jgi:hypothetical protein
VSAPSLGVPGKAQAALSVGLLLVFLSQFGHVSPANFGGSDEWLIVDLASRGVLGVPYAHRPLVFLWTIPAPRLWPHDLWAFYVLHGLWLFLAGWLTLLLARRLLPDRPILWYLAGTAAVVWAPEDFLRLDSVLLVGYAGFTFAALAALVLFVESWFHGSRGLLVLAAALAAVTATGFEGTLPLLAGAPLVVLVLEPVRSRRLAAWVGGWWLLTGGLTGVAALSVLGARAGTYQSTGLGFDPHPGRVLLRILGQFGYHLGPIVRVSPSELGHAAVAVSTVLFLATLAMVVRVSPAGAAGPEPRRPLAAAAALGLVLAALGYSLLMLSPSILRAARTQFLSGPGIALFLASSAGLLATFVPRRARAAVLAALGAWIVAVGMGRTLAMQREWDAGLGRYAGQHATLDGLTHLAPRLAPHTFVILLDGAATWPTSFTFRHALSYLYEGAARGQVLDGNDFLYALAFRPEGVVSVPWPVLEAAWGETPSLYRYDEVVVARDLGQGQVALVPQWPAESLGPLPPGARYAPDARIVPTAARPASQSILRLRPREGRVPAPLDRLFPGD